MMKRVFLFVLIFFHVNTSSSQTGAVNFLNAIANETIDFHLAIVAPSEEYRRLNRDKLVVSSYQLVLLYPKLPTEMPHSVYYETVSRLTELLKDPTKDWAAHVILTALTKRNIGTILGIENRNDWILNCKTQDSIHWVNNFTSLK